MVRGRDACWEHCVLVDVNRQKVRCNYCQREFSGGVYRMKFHLAQVKNKDIVPCTEVPIDVRDRILTVLTAPKKQKAAKKSKVDQPAFENDQQNSSSASGGQNGSLLFPLPSPSDHLAAEDVSKRNSKQEEADKKIAVFFFHNCIPFSAAKSVYYQEMVDAIADSGVGYQAPSYEKLKSSLMEKVKGDMYDLYKKYRDEWSETGCTVLCDSWSKSNDATKSLVVFSVTCLKGTLFLKSFDVSDNKDDGSFLFELIESVVLEIGVENVIQVITDNTACYSYAGRLLMAKYKSLFWSPSASCCIDEILEDLGKLDWVSTVLEEAKTITRFLYSHPWSLETMRKFNGGRELIRPKINRYVTDFLSLRSIVIQEDNLKHMFSHSEWLSSEAQAVKSLLYLERFWKYAREAVNVSEPLVKILRMVDGDIPAMGYFYEAIERAKNSIQGYYKGVEEKYLPIWKMIERLQAHSSLHAAAAFLNPSVCYNPIFKTDLKLRNGFQEAMLRVAIEDNDKMEITREIPVYLNAQGAFATGFAVLGRTLNSPGDWWATYGYEIPTLQRAAVRILSQPCSSHCRLWNWTTFDAIHCKKRSRVESEKLNDFAFVHCNLWLQSTLHSRRGISKAVDFDHIDVAADWPAELDPPEPLLDDSWLDHLSLEKEK